LTRPLTITRTHDDSAPPASKNKKVSTRAGSARPAGRTVIKKMTLTSVPGDEVDAGQRRLDVHQQEAMT
jgi:hypothetical protein